MKVDTEKLREWIANQSATFLDHVEGNEYASGSYDAYECTLRFLNALESENDNARTGIHGQAGRGSDEVAASVH
jgi:hypothetical protein